MGRHCFEQTPSKISIVLETALMRSEKASNTRCVARPNKAQIGKARRREPFAGHNSKCLNMNSALRSLGIALAVLITALLVFLTSLAGIVLLVLGMPLTAFCFATPFCRLPQGLSKAYTSSPISSAGRVSASG
jgi:hypothetical protein